MSGNEAAAIGSMRTIFSSQQSYASSCGNGYYASTLLILGSAPAASQPFISPDLSTSLTVVKTGYWLTMFQGSEATAAPNNGCNPLGVAANLYTSYVTTAYPLSGNVTGTRWFFGNTLGTVFQNNTTFASTVGNTPPGAGTAIQ
jgi:hypothetical protein